MVTTGAGRGPIKVGSGYIDVFPRINQKQLKETRAQLEKQMGASGKAAGKTFVEGVTSQVATLPKKAKAAAEKAQKEIQKSSMDSKKVLKRIEQEITRDYGKEAGRRFRDAAELEKKKQKLLETTSAATRKAIQTTVREEQKASQSKAKSWQAAEKERLRLLRERERAERQAHVEEARRWETSQRSYLKYLRDREKAAAKAAREEATAYRRAHQQMREDIRQTLTAARAARVADLRGQMDGHRDQLTALRGQLRDYRRQMDDHTRSVGRSLTGLQTSWRRQGEAIERLGTNITETGRLVSMNLLAPLGAVAGMLTTIGVKSADMRILGQMGLGAAGVSQKQSAAQMNEIQRYAIDTPFSIDTMHEYQMKLIRSIAGNDAEWYKPKTKTAAADRAADKTTDVIKSIGDTMARAGNLDPEMFKRAMYAIDRIMDLNKAPTRNINQLVQATGLSGGELARMFGFKDAGEFWKTAGTPVAKGGGLSGEDMVDNLLQVWDPNYFMKGKDGKRTIDPSTGRPIVNTAEHEKVGGSAGYGERMTSATITGRISQMKERAQFELGSLFAQENKKTGEYEYTGLGQSIMGKATGEDKNGNTTYEGGLLQQVQQLGGDQKGNVVALIQTSLEGLAIFVEQIQWFSDWLAAHPQVKEVFANLLKMAAVALPFIIAIGLLTKVFGKVAKIFGAVTGPAARGVQGASRTVRQTTAGARSARSGGGFREGYRERRTALRGGDTRGPVARVRDRITGRDSQTNQIRAQMRETEDAISETEEAMRRLQRQLRDVNAVSVRQLVDQFAGRGSGTLQGAATNAGSQVNSVTTQVGQLNRAGLGTVGGEVNELQDNVKELNKKISKSSQLMGELNGKNLNGLKLAVDSAHGTVGDLKDKVENTALEVSALNRKGLGKLSAEFDGATSAGDTLHDKTKAAIRQVSGLNGAKLGAIKKEFGFLHTSVNDVHKLVGTSKSGLHGRVTNLDNRSLSKVTKAVEGLKTALDGAGDKAGTLEDRLKAIADHAPGKGDSGGSSGKKTTRATGGILPGYTPGQDVHVFSSPTAGQLHLSGGEAVMRPEWTAAVGTQEINRMNLLARTKGVQGVRQAIQFKDGGVLGKLGLDGLLEGSKSFSVGSNVRGAAATMEMDAKTPAIGGTVQSGVIGAGTKGSHFIGANLSDKFRGMFDYLSKDSWEALRKAPIPTGVSQVVGTLGGAVAPVAGDYLWNDVWKGKGNILERGEDFMGHLFSTKTLKSVVSNLLGGGWDSLKSLWGGASDFMSDPTGFISDGIGGVWELVKSQYGGVVDMVQGMKEIWESPESYAYQVIKDVYSTAKENLPNLNQIFDFSGEGLSSSPPNIDKLLEAGGPGTARSLAWARTQNGLPYQWGGNGNPSWDCSGFLSAIESVIRGQKPHRRWATGAFSGSTAPDGWVRGLKSPFMIGITNAGVGHTAGTLNGVNVESRGGDGVIVGPGARGADSSLFTDVYGFRSSVPKGYATGTDGAAPGWAWVGEEGPELVNFSGGETVLNARDSLVAGKDVEKGYASGTKNSGLYKAMMGSTSQLNSALTKLRDLLSKAFSADLISKSKHGSLSKWLEKENATLTKAAGKRASIAQKIKDANAKVAELKEQRNDLRSTVASQASGGTPLLNAFNSGGGVSVAGVLSGMKDRLKAIADFKANLSALRKKGYGNAVITEVAGAGLDQGNEMAKALLTADTSEVKDITKTYDNVFKQSNALGKSVSEDFYKAGSKSALALVKGLQSEEKKILKSITSLVEKAISKIRKGIGIGKGEPVRADIATILSWLTGISQPAKSTTKKPAKKKKGYWTGTLSASPGLAMVGERGPELVNFRGGERVFNSRDTDSLLSSGRPIYITVNEAKSENTTDAVVRAFGYLDTMYGNRL